MNNLQRLVAVAAILSGLNVYVVAVAASLQFESPTPSAGRNEQQSASVGNGELQTQSGEAESVFQAALLLYHQRKYDDALANCIKASALNPNDYRPHALAGYVYQAQRKLKSASDAFGEAILLQPQKKELYLAKAFVDYLRNSHEEALDACRKAVQVDANYAEAYSMIGELLQFDEKRRAEAIAALKSAIKINPALPRPYDLLGGILESAKDEKGAEEVFRQGMTADPKHMGGRFALGRMLVKQGRLAEARELWEGRTSDEDRTHPQFIELLKRPRI